MLNSCSAHLTMTLTDVPGNIAIEYLLGWESDLEMMDEEGDMLKNTHSEVAGLLRWDEDLDLPPVTATPIATPIATPLTATHCGPCDRDPHRDPC